jgi:hypothetical protein
MNPLWKKAKWDVVSKEDLERWYEVETALKQKPILTFFHHLLNDLQPVPDAKFYEETWDLSQDEESWGDPQMDDGLDSWEDEKFVDERPQEMKDKEAANLALFEAMAKEHPELRHFADNFLNAMGGLADLGDDEEFSDFIEMDMMCDRIWASSMNQVLDEDVDCSGESNFNLNELMYGTRSLS